MREEVVRLMWEVGWGVDMGVKGGGLCWANARVSAMDCRRIWIRIRLSREIRASAESTSESFRAEHSYLYYWHLSGFCFGYFKCCTSMGLSYQRN